MGRGLQLGAEAMNSRSLARQERREAQRESDPALKGALEALVSPEEFGGYQIAEATGSGFRSVWAETLPEDHARASGWLAFHEGGRCPYRKGSRKRALWEEGYALAEREGRQVVKDAIREAVYAEVGKPEEFFSAVQAWLDDSGFSQGELAKMAGVSRATINRWIGGKVKPDPEKMRKLAAIIEELSDAERPERERRRPLEVRQTPTLPGLTPRQQRQMDKRAERMGSPEFYARKAKRDALRAELIAEEFRPRPTRDPFAPPTVFGRSGTGYVGARRQTNWPARREAMKRFRRTKGKRRAFDPEAPSQVRKRIAEWVHAPGRKQERSEPKVSTAA